MPYTQLELFDCISKRYRHFALIEVELSRCSSPIDGPVEQLGLRTLDSELGKLQKEGLDGSWWRYDCHLRTQWCGDSLPVGGRFPEYRFDEPGASSFEMRAHPDPGNTATATSGTSQRALDESIQSAVQRARESDGVGEIE